MILKGQSFVLGNDIDTDIIIPTEYLALESVNDMKKYAFSPLNRNLAKKIQPGDIIVAGSNFGCGSSREQAPEIIKALGVNFVLAKSFARIFFRNAFNNGLLLIEHQELPDIVREGDELILHTNEYIEHKGKKFPIAPLPDNLFEIISAGGLVEAMKIKNKVK